MAAIPILTFSAGFCDEKSGSLLNPPTELFSPSQRSYYANCKLGWTTCPLGYHVFAVTDDLKRKMVVPGIYLTDGKPPKRKFPNYPIKFSKQQIENFAKSHLEMPIKVKEKIDTEFRNLTHDLRAISNEIYHNALAAREAVDELKNASVVTKIDTVLAAQLMLSIRFDVIDYERGLASGRPSELIEPYKKTEKVVRCFQNKINNKHLKRQIEGSCFSKIWGPPIFEIIPFVIMENAVKYAPQNTEILVKIEESEDKIFVRFDSVGPEVKDSEKKKIFEENYRGMAVRHSERSGSGIGLYAAKTLLESHFGGEIKLNQFEQTNLISKEPFFKTRFTVIVPKAIDNDISIRPSFRRPMRP
jgi:hypothetical protein